MITQNNMKFHAFSQKGSTHLINQDYYLLDDNFAVISDGCSAVRNAEEGSKLLTESLYRSLKNPDLDSIEKIYNQALLNAYNTTEDKNSLHATLGSIALTSDGINLSLQGDGDIYYQTSDGYVLYNFDSTRIIMDRRYSMPYYPLYQVTGGNGYLDNFPFRKVNRLISKNGHISEDSWYIPSDDIFSLTVVSSLVAIFTDGIESYLTTDGAAKVPVYTMVEQFMSLCGGSEQFLAEAYDLTGLSHYDDLTIICGVL